MSTCLSTGHLVTLHVKQFDHCSVHVFHSVCQHLIHYFNEVTYMLDMLKYEDMSFIKRPSQLLATLALILIFVTIYDLLAPGLPPLVRLPLLASPKQSAQSINNDLPQVYKDRQSHIQSVCEEHHDRFVMDYKRFQPRMSFHSVITKVDLFKSRTSSPFLWCRVPKASSQSWNDLFMSIW